MGAEPMLSVPNKEDKGIIVNSPPAVLGLQPSAIVDHVARIDWSFLDQIPGERGGSMPVAVEELQHILSEVTTHIVPLDGESCPVKTLAGGSVTNTIRGLSANFGVSSGIIGACGDDEQGQLFLRNMSFNNVDIARLRINKGATGQCICLVDQVGNRTMRPCVAKAVKLQVDELTRENFRGSKWLVLRYAIFNLELIRAAIRIAKQEGLYVSLDLASFEMVRNFRGPLLELLESGDIDLCFANEDEAEEVIRGREDTGPEAAVDYLAKHCRWAVVTLGSNGCIAKHGSEMVKAPAIGETQATDATGAGDLFASGFLYGLINGLSLMDCCRAGSCSGGSVIRSLGGEITPENHKWMNKQMNIKGLPVPSTICS